MGFEPTRPLAELAKIRGYSARLNRIIGLLINTLATTYRFIAESWRRSLFCKIFSPTHEITDIAGYLLTTDDEYSVHMTIFGQRCNVLNKKE